MKKILATALASAAFMGMAYAATMESVVQAVDPASRTVTLADGQSFVAPEGVAIESLQPGAKIMITVDDTTGAVTKVEAAS